MSDNPQFIRTDNAIIHAFTMLLKRKPFEKITVQDILDETPVTRSTFYAHFRDKYEIGERIMEEFLRARKVLRQMMRANRPLAPETLRQQFRFNREHLDLLLNVQTQNVNFRKALAEDLEAEYLAASSSPAKELEARIYSQVWVELFLSLLRNEYTQLDADAYRQAMIRVTLRLLHIPEDREAYAYLSRRMARAANDRREEAVGSR